MKLLEKMTKEERALLLYFEDCAVYKSGRVSTEHLNAADRETAQNWNAEGFVLFGRIASGGISSGGSHWCYLNDPAWDLAAQERKARALRTWNKRTWQTTAERRAIA